jgi:putative aldouronate transport system permease protein
MLYPFIYVLSISFSSGFAIQSNSVWLLPKGFQINSYKAFYDDAVTNVFRAFANSATYSLLTVLGADIITALAAYPLINKNLVFRRLITVIITIPMFFGGTFIQIYINLTNLKLINTMWAIILPALLNTWNIMIMRTYFTSTIPDSLRESAIIDGATEWRVLFRIYVPLSKAVFAIIGLYCFVWQWNNFFGPFLYLNDVRKYPLTLVLQKVMAYEQGWYKSAYVPEGDILSMKSAAMIISFLPILVAYPFIQRYFVKGVMIGSIKG